MWEIHEGKLIPASLESMLNANSEREQNFDELLTLYFWETLVYASSYQENDDLETICILIPTEQFETF